MKLNLNFRMKEGVMVKKVKIFFPVDVDSEEKAEVLVREVGPHVEVIKIGLELEKHIGTPAMIALAKKSGKEVFVDVKLNDIPNTVKGAAKGITAHGVDYFNVMAMGGKAMMEAAVEGATDKARELGIAKPKIIAVTVLTSLIKKDLIDLRIIPSMELLSSDNDQEYISEIVLIWANLAVEAGVDCILSSPKEVAAIRARYPSIEIICPGIRPPWAPLDDQKRTMTPGEAAKAGADGLVIGRPISKPAEGMTREDSVRRIREDINSALGIAT